MIVQTASFRFLAPRIERGSLKGNAFNGLALRAAAYTLIGISVYFLTGLLYLGTTIVLYSLAAGVAYAIYYAASNVMVFNTLGHSNQGSALGVYSALVGFATMLGSFISGFVSFFLGFYVTFILAAIFLAVAATSTSAMSAG
jgi:MFS family permease